MTPLSVFTCAADTGAGRYTVTDPLGDPFLDAATNSYAACNGYNLNMLIEPYNGNGMFQRNSHVKIAEVSDGLGQTLLIGERAALFARHPGSAFSPAERSARLLARPYIDRYCTPNRAW